MRGSADGRGAGVEGETVLKGEAAADEDWNAGAGESSRWRRLTRRAGPVGGADNAGEGSFFGVAVATSGAVQRRGVTEGGGNGRAKRALELREMMGSTPVESGAARKAGGGRRGFIGGRKWRRRDDRNGRSWWEDDERKG